MPVEEVAFVARSFLRRGVLEEDPLLLVNLSLASVKVRFMRLDTLGFLDEFVAENAYQVDWDTLKILLASLKQLG
jgi:hypothetical protein